MSEVRNIEDKPKTGDWQGTRSVKQLRSAVEAVAFQKEWFKKARERVDEGEPFAIVSVNAPHEILTTMDILFIPVQWWSAVISAKRLSPYYFNLMDERGYRNLCRYCVLPLACTMDHNPERAPWGGLPKPTVILGERMCNVHSKIFELWAREYDVPLFQIEQPAPIVHNSPWWERIKSHWDEYIEPCKLNLRVEELKTLIRFLEVTTGKTFSHSKFMEVMKLINEHEDYYTKARDLIAATVPCPISIPDQIAGTMNPQYHRGTQWGLNMAKMFYEEVKERVDKGIGIFKGEKLRLMWLGIGLWHNTAFYQYFEEKYGAVFVCSQYLSYAADGYARDLLGDPIKALAGRHLFLGGGDNWLVKEAKLHKVKGAVMIVSGNCARNVGNIFTKIAFEDAGIPVLPIYADVVDAREWDDTKIKSQVSSFIEERLLQNK